VIAGAWWYAAFRLSSHWILFALAIIATIGLILTAAIIFLAQSRQFQSYLTPLSDLRTILAVLEAGAYVIFVDWLVARVKAE
jgi:hypothetical protein